MDTWRSVGGAGGGGASVTVVDDNGELSVVENWKSARRRSAHLLAEQTVEGLNLEGLLGGGGTGTSSGLRRPKSTWLKACIAVSCVLKPSLCFCYSATE